MVLNVHRPVGDSDAGKKHGAHGGRFTLRRRGMVAASLVSMTALSLSAVSAEAAVGGGRSIEVFTGSNLLSLTGYPADTDVRVEVLRQGFVIGSAVKHTDADGAIEMNHSGVTDCFDGPSSPDIGPRDTIRTTILPSGVRDTSVVRGVWVDDIQYGATTITVSGHVTLAGASKVVPNADVLELRINKDTVWDGTGRSDLRVDIGANVQPSGTWTRVINASAQDVDEAQASSETFLEWSAAPVGEEEGFPPELTVWDAAGGEPLDCPTLQQEPTAPKLANAMDSGKVGDHVTNQSANLTFSGLTGTAGANANATLFVDGVAGPTVQANAQGVYSFADVSLPARGQAYALKVRATSEDESLTLTSVVRKVTVDTVAPRLVQRRFGPNPLHLAGREQLRAVYRVNEASKVAAEVQHRFPTRTVNTLAVRNLRAAGLVAYSWNGQNENGRNVQPGKYQMVLTSTDAAGNQSTERALFRVVR